MVSSQSELEAQLADRDQRRQVGEVLAARREEERDRRATLTRSGLSVVAMEDIAIRET